MIWFFLFWKLSIMKESLGVRASFICERYFVEQTLDMVLLYREILMPTFSFNGRAINWSLRRVMWCDVMMLMLMKLIDNFWRNFSTFLSSTVKISFSSLRINHLNSYLILILMIKLSFWLCLTCPADTFSNRTLFYHSKLKVVGLSLSSSKNKNGTQMIVK